MRYSPWRELRHRPDIDLHWTKDDDYLRGADALWFPETREIVMDARLLQVSRRCALAHELAHVVREDGPCLDPLAQTRQEVAADRLAARWLIPDTEVLAAGLNGAASHGHAAQTLWVTLHMLEVRLHSLHPSEVHALRALRSDHGATGFGLEL
jgi:Zn-dependent peptidase ImmA (M78 family)